MDIKRCCAIGLIGLLLPTACSTIDVQKVPAKTQYEKLDDDERDELQKQADDINGLRYYLPRPFIVVKKEFPIKSTTSLVHGFLIGDGKYASIRLVDEEGKNKINLLNDSGQQTVAAVFQRAKTGKKSELKGESKSGVGGNATGSNTNQMKLRFEDRSFFKGAIVAKTIDHNHKPIDLSFTLESAKFGDLSLKTIRKIALVPVSGTQLSQDQELEMPLEFYDLSSGLYKFKDHISGLSQLSYVLAVTFFQTLDTKTYIERTVHTPIFEPVLTVTGTTQETDANRGIADSTGVVGASNWNDKVIVILPEPNIRQLKGPLKLKFTLQDGYGTDAVAFVNPEVVRVSLWSLNNQNQPQEMKYSLPHELWNNKTFDYIGVSGVGAGNYQAVIHVRHGDENQRSITRITGSEARFVVTQQPVVSLPDPDKQPSSATNSTPSNTGEEGTQTNSGSQSSPTTQLQNQGGQPDSSTTTTTKEQTTPGGAGSLTLVAGGDGKPSIVNLSELIDIAYLPDFEEQYAIQPKARLSKANVSISLENGWSLEGFNVDIDNRAIANFVFAQLDKTLDLVRDVVSLKRGLIAGAPPSAPAPTESSAPSSSADGISPESKSSPLTVLFKVHKIIYAVPGLYPILKRSEQQQEASTVKSWKPYQFDTREEIIVEVVDFSPPQQTSMMVNNNSVKQDDSPLLATLDGLINNALKGVDETKNLKATITKSSTNDKEFLVRLSNIDGSQPSQQLKSKAISIISVMARPQGIKVKFQ